MLKMRKIDYYLNSLLGYIPNKNETRSDIIEMIEILLTLTDNQLDDLISKI